MDMIGSERFASIDKVSKVMAIELISSSRIGLKIRKIATLLKKST